MLPRIITQLLLQKKPLTLNQQAQKEEFGANPGPICRRLIYVCFYPYPEMCKEPSDSYSCDFTQPGQPTDQRIRVDEFGLDYYSGKPLTNLLMVIPAQAGEVVQGCTVYGPKDGIQENQAHGLFASLTLRADFQSFNALRAFVRPSPE